MKDDDLKFDGGDGKKHLSRIHLVAWVDNRILRFCDSFRSRSPRKSPEVSKMILEFLAKATPQIVVPFTGIRKIWKVLRLGYFLLPSSFLLFNLVFCCLFAFCWCGSKKGARQHEQIHLGQVKWGMVPIQNWDPRLSGFPGKWHLSEACLNAALPCHDWVNRIDGLNNLLRTF